MEPTIAEKLSTMGSAIKSAFYNWLTTTQSCGGGGQTPLNYIKQGCATEFHKWLDDNKVEVINAIAKEVANTTEVSNKRMPSLPLPPMPKFRHPD